MGLFHKKTAEEIEAKRAEKEANKGKYKKIFAASRDRWVGPPPPAREEVERTKFTPDSAVAFMPVKHVFRMGRKNVALMGTVQKGSIAVGDTVLIAEDFGAIDKSVVTSINQLGSSFDYAPEGAMVQVTLDAPNINVRKGDILFKTK